MRLFVIIKYLNTQAQTLSPLSTRLLPLFIRTLMTWPLIGAKVATAAVLN